MYNNKDSKIECVQARSTDDDGDDGDDDNPI